MTAIVSGVKTNDGELSINQFVVRSEPNNAVIQANKATTILEQAGDAVYSKLLARVALQI
jgi:alkaline phosphatase